MVKTTEHFTPELRLMTEAVRNGERTVGAPQLWDLLFRMHPEWVTCVIRALDNSDHHTIPAFHEELIIPRSQLIGGISPTQIPGFSNLRPGIRFSGHMGNVFDTRNWGQEYIYAGAGEWNPAPDAILDMAAPVTIPFLDFEYPLTPDTLEKIVSTLDSFGHNWFLLESGGGSAHAIIDYPMPDITLIGFYAATVEELISHFPQFDNTIYRQIVADMWDCHRNFTDVAKLRRLRESLRAVTNHVDERSAAGMRAFPLDLRYLGHCFERMAAFIEHKYLGKNKELLSAPEWAAISYLRFNGKYPNSPGVVALNYRGHRAVREPAVAAPRLW